MKTKIQIIQSLLDERKITAEEAMTLMQTEKEYVYLPYQQPTFDPFRWQPYVTTGGDSMTVRSMEFCN